MLNAVSACIHVHECVVVWAIFLFSAGSLNKINACANLERRIICQQTISASSYTLIACTPTVQKASE